MPVTRKTSRQKPVPSSSEQEPLTVDERAGDLTTSLSGPPAASASLQLPPETSEDPPQPRTDIVQRIVQEDTLMSIRWRRWKLSSTLYRCRCHHQFLSDCEKEQLIPRGLRVIHPLTGTLADNALAVSWQKHLDECSRQLRTQLIHHYEEKIRNIMIALSGQQREEKAQLKECGKDSPIAIYHEAKKEEQDKKIWKLRTEIHNAASRKLSRLRREKSSGSTPDPSPTHPHAEPPVL